MRRVLWLTSCSALSTFLPLARTRAFPVYNAKKSFTSFTDGVIGLIISEMWVKDFFLSILHLILCIAGFDRVVKDFRLFYISLQVFDFEVKRRHW